MRPSGTAATLGLVLAGSMLTAHLSGQPTLQQVSAEPDPIPSREQIQDAQDAAAGAATDVDSVQGALAAANQRLESSSIAAAQAAEAYNGARWQAEQARKASRLADREAAAAAADYERQSDIYADTVVTAYETMPELSGLTAVLASDDLATMLDRSNTLENASGAMDQREDDFRAASQLADVASDRAQAAEADAVAAKTQAEEARDQARAAADAAAAEAQAVAAERDHLIGELARLQGVSVELAAQRQAGLEERARQRAAAAAAAEAAAQRAAEEAAEAAQAEEAAQQAAEEAAQAAEEQADSTETPTEQPSDEPDTTPPAPGGGAQAAIAFARAQIGDSYVWGAEGPGSWDCSGLTMGAWAAGGTSLPHYSVAQYEQSTPISASELQPGDLVFWGSSGSSSSIYHVALYSGDGMIIHAPRSGRDVEEVSMYYWITPNFYARP